jgi:hypothetical protein
MAFRKFLRLVEESIKLREELVFRCELLSIEVTKFVNGTKEAKELLRSWDQKNLSRRPRNIG